MFYYPWNKLFVFFFGVLFIEDAIGLVLESDTTKTVAYVM